MKNSGWQNQKATLDYLKAKAKSYTRPIRVLTWLKLIGLIPMTTEYRGSNNVPTPPTDPDNITAGYLAGLAYDWDREGITTPSEFLIVLENYELAIGRKADGWFHE